MSRVVADLSLLKSPKEPVSSRSNKKYSRPLTLEETGLSEILLTELLSKHLLEAGVLDMAGLCVRMALSGPVLETLVQFMRQEALVEIKPSYGGQRSLRYNLTDKGRQFAHDCLSKSGYQGPAPIPLEVYQELVKEQSIHNVTVTDDMMAEGLAGVTLTDGLRDQLGPAMNSGRAIFVYGHAGTGKTYITKKMAPIFGDAIFIPFAIAIGEAIIQIFDPVLHKAINTDHLQPQLRLEEGSDARLILCQRPVLITGGELSIDMLNVTFDHDLRQYRAPLQLKVNNGIYIIDDMGRQRSTPKEIFNRWIVPLEEQKDYLTLGSGRHFEVPFDEVVIFSSNINPLELADEAYLRRIGYKIHFVPMSRSEYCRVWEQECSINKVEFDRTVLDFVIDSLHLPNEKPLLPCMPRDLLSIAIDYSKYKKIEHAITKESIRWAWNNYFVQLNESN